MSSITHVAQGNHTEPHKTVSSLQRLLTLLDDHRGSRSLGWVWMAPPSLPVSSCLLLLIALHHLLVQPCLQSKRREQAPDFLGKGRSVFVGVRGREGGKCVIRWMGTPPLDLYLKSPCKLALRIYFSLGFCLLFLMILGCNLFWRLSPTNWCLFPWWWLRGYLYKQMIPLTIHRIY